MQEGFYEKPNSMRFAYLDPLGNGDVNIYRVCDGKCIPWLAVRDSLMMQQHLQQKGKGLYALQSFKQGEYIGRYSGRLVAHEQDAASLSNSSDKLQEHYHIDI